MKTSIFIDGNNFYFSLKRIYEDRDLNDFDFGRFCDFLAGDNDIVDIFYYNAELDKRKNYGKYLSQKKFFDRIGKIPKFNLILCNLVKRRIGDEFFYTLKEDDIHLAVDLIIGACDGLYDGAMIISGDGDFVPAVLAIQGKEKRVVNVCFKKGSSIKLKKSCDKVVKLNKGILDRFFI